MDNKKTLIALLILALLVIFGYMLFNGEDQIDTTGDNSDMEGEMMNGENSDPNDTSSTPQPVKTSQIRVDTPLPNSTISSPLKITGEARGTWYFEASFPVKLLDANGNILAQGPAQAQGDWMTTEFVPFETTLNFSSSPTATGTLVLEKDNPSGLSENADEVRVPVRFSQTSQSERGVILYYYNPEKDKDSSGNIMCTSNGLVGVERTIPNTITPIQDTIKLLIEGDLTSAEKARGITTEFPLAGFELTGAALSNGNLNLSFNDPNNETVGGSCRVAVLTSQIRATAKQFSAVNAVTFEPDTLFQP